jgi:hypothetical protein
VGNLNLLKRILFSRVARLGLLKDHELTVYITDVVKKEVRSTLDELEIWGEMGMFVYELGK